MAEIIIMPKLGFNMERGHQLPNPKRSPLFRLQRGEFLGQQPVL